jgi:hypothetical protein
MTGCYSLQGRQGSEYYNKKMQTASEKKVDKTERISLLVVGLMRNLNPRSSRKVPHLPTLRVQGLHGKLKLK